MRRRHLAAIALLAAAVLSPTFACADLTPAGIFRLALVDLETVEPSQRIYTRYASLHTVPPEDRATFVKAFVISLNSTSFRSKFARPVVVNNELVRISLTDLGWDVYSRTDTINKLSKDGIKFLDTNKEEFRNIWEGIGAANPHFRSTLGHVRGWLNPVDVEKARVVAYTNYLVVSASWLLTRLWLEKEDGGFYSQLLLLPDAEDQTLKRFTNIAAIDRENLTRGGAVVESNVALNARELQLIPALFGFEHSYIHRTKDFAVKDDREKDPFVTLGGKSKHDGREVIGSLPNGLIWSALYDSGTGKDDGKRVSVVPQNIALIKVLPAALKNQKVYDRNVVNAIGCVRCHWPESGIISYDDQVKPMIVSKDSIALLVKSKDKAFVATETQRLEEFYLSGLENPAGPTGLETRIALQKQSFAARTIACNGLDPTENAIAVTDAFDKYFWRPVDLDQASRELGYPPEEARQLMLAASDPKIAHLRVNEYNPELALLRAGTPIRRATWEKFLGEAHRSQVYADWEVANPEALKKALKAK